MQDNIALRDGMANTMAVYGNNNNLSIFHERDKHGHADLADALCSAIWRACSEEEEPQEVEMMHTFDTTELLEHDFLTI